MGLKFRGSADHKLLDKLAFITFFGTASLRIIKSDAAPYLLGSIQISPIIYYIAKSGICRQNHTTQVI